jgi:hypothetical protein
MPQDESGMYRPKVPSCVYPGVDLPCESEAEGKKAVLTGNSHGLTLMIGVVANYNEDIRADACELPMPATFVRGQRDESAEELAPAMPRDLFRRRRMLEVPEYIGETESMRRSCRPKDVVPRG